VSRLTTTGLRAYSIGVGVLMMLPLVTVVVASLTADGYVSVPPRHWGLVWYEAALSDRAFMSAFKFSAISAPLVALISGGLGVASAVALQRYRFRGRNAIQAVLMAPMMLPHIVIAIGLVQLFATLRVSSSPYGLIAGHIVITMPFVLRIALAGLAGIDPMLEAASYSLGASRRYTVTHILVPLMGPAVTSGVVFAFILSFDEATIALFTASPGFTSIPVQIFNYAENRSDPLVTAVSSLLVLFALTVMLVLERKFGLLRLLSGGDTRG